MQEAKISRQPGKTDLLAPSRGWVRCAKLMGLDSRRHCYTRFLRGRKSVMGRMGGWEMCREITRKDAKQHVRKRNSAKEFGGEVKNILTGSLAKINWNKK